MKTNFIKTVILFVMTYSCFAHAAISTERIPYYGEEFFQDLNSGVSDQTLLMRLKVVLNSYHTPQAGGLDKISQTCGGAGCYVHTALSYDGARRFLFGSFYLIPEGSGYGIKDVYCHENAKPEDFNGSAKPGPGLVPDSTVINTEHTWPQSRFNRRHRKDFQKSDLHHLFPTDSQINAIRGNYWFGEVVQDTETLKCHNVRFGKSADGDQEVFEPPQEHRGNVARAMFYFATRYDLQIDPRQEAVLRKWHRDDPVDEEELDRNVKIAELQGNRNPFIDYTDLVDRVRDF